MNTTSKPTQRRATAFAEFVTMPAASDTPERAMTPLGAVLREYTDSDAFDGLGDSTRGIYRAALRRLLRDSTAAPVTHFTAATLVEALHREEAAAPNSARFRQYLSAYRTFQVWAANHGAGLPVLRDLRREQVVRINVPQSCGAPAAEATAPGSALDNTEVPDTLEGRLAREVRVLHRTIAGMERTLESLRALGKDAERLRENLRTEQKRRRLVAKRLRVRIKHVRSRGDELEREEKASPLPAARDEKVLPSGRTAGCGEDPLPQSLVEALTAAVNDAQHPCKPRWLRDLHWHDIRVDTVGGGVIFKPQGEPGYFTVQSASALSVCLQEAASWLRQECPDMVTLQGPVLPAVRGAPTLRRLATLSRLLTRQQEATEPADVRGQPAVGLDVLRALEIQIPNAVVAID